MTIIVIPRAFMVALGFTKVRPAKQFISGFYERARSLPNKEFTLRISRKVGTIKVIRPTQPMSIYANIARNCAGGIFNATTANALSKWILDETEREATNATV